MPTAMIPILLMLFIVLYTQHEEKQKQIRQLLSKKQREGRKNEMKELAKQFIEKECIIDTMNRQMEGTLRQISEGAILLERNGSTEAINLDYVVRIREYPRNKNGKKKSVVLD